MAVIKEKTNTFPKQNSCFICGELLQIPYIFWQGGNGEAIGLHGDCAEYLGISLLSDYLIYPTSRLRKVKCDG